MSETCTCETEIIKPHNCPFQEDVNGDCETKCKCCEYCEEQCCDDI